MAKETKLKQVAKATVKATKASPKRAAQTIKSATTKKKDWI